MKNKPLREDIIIVGGGIMGLTLAALINEIKPENKIILIERLSGCGEESSKGLNNAGTGHAGYCELNYTPMKSGKVDITRAIEINEMFESSLQFWAYLDANYSSFKPKKFLRKIPHISFVEGIKNVDFLKKRYEALRKQPVFKGMEFTTSLKKINEWAPLVMTGRNKENIVAATRINHGTDIDFGELTTQLLALLKKNSNFKILLNKDVASISKNSSNEWIVTMNCNNSGKKEALNSSKVFIAAGGKSVSLLQKIKLKEISGYGGFPLSGKWLVCTNPSIVKQHNVKVYGQALPKAPPMSIPHLDLRVIGKTKTLMFGPFAGCTLKFLKNGSILDFPKSIRLNNAATMLSIFFNNLKLVKFLISQSLDTHNIRMKQLKNYYPAACNKDWVLLSAGQRVQILKIDNKGFAKIEFGTEIIYTEDRSLAGIIGASPGASISAHSMIDVLCELFPDVRQSTISNIVPGYGHALNKNPKKLNFIRKKVYAQLGL